MQYNQRFEFTSTFLSIRQASLGLLALAVFCAAVPVQAGSHTWSGAVSGYFNNNANWSNGGAPVAGETDVVLNFPPGATRYTITNNVTGLNVTAINFLGDNYVLGGNPISFVGSGQTNLSNSGSMNFLVAPLVLSGSNMTVNVTAGRELYLNSPVSGAGGLIKVGAGSLRYHGMETNSYTGTTYVSGGTLVMARTYGYERSVPGPLVVGTILGVQGSVFAKALFHNQLGQAAPVTINITGVLQIEGGERIGGLILGGGEVQTGTNVLTLSGNISVLTGTATISGRLSLYDTVRTIDVVPGGTLNVPASISSYLTAGLLKTGAGSLHLQGSNTFAGPVTVKQGYLTVSHNKALPAQCAVTVTNAAIMQLFDLNVSQVSLTLSGNGNGNGALRAFGSNVWNGSVTLAAPNTGIQCYGGGDLLILSKSISGAGGLNKLGAGTLLFTGSEPNSYLGATRIIQGTLQLAKTNAIAVPQNLIVGDNTNAWSSRVVQFYNSEQIADRADVIVNYSGLLDFTRTTVKETLGALSGTGTAALGFSDLLAGTNDADMVFGGTVTGLPGSSFSKSGAGKMTLTGTNLNFFGATMVKSGMLVLDGSLASSGVYVFVGATVSGNGIAKSVWAPGGNVSPGNSTGILNSGNFDIGFDGFLNLELNGTAPGMGHDQVRVVGTVSVTNAILKASLGFQSALSNKFVIIDNDGGDLVMGSFKNLPEGTPFIIGNALFTISYHGGDGNDVELTQISAQVPSQIGGISTVGGDQMEIHGVGLPGAVYTVEANHDLGTTNWVKLGTANADPQSGAFSFVDVNAANYPQRFYRLKQF